MGNLIVCLRFCTNLENFTCTPNILPALLHPLQDHPDLQSLRVSAILTAQQTACLASMTRLKSISLDSCSWNVVDVLPKWASTLTTSLTSLVLYVSDNSVVCLYTISRAQTIQEMNDCILETMLPHLHNLTNLSVVGCSKVEHGTVLLATRHTPKLESLAVTAWVGFSIDMCGGSS